MALTEIFEKGLGAAIDLGKQYVGSKYGNLSASEQLEQQRLQNEAAKANAEIAAAQQTTSVILSQKNMLIVGGLIIAGIGVYMLVR